MVWRPTYTTGGLAKASFAPCLLFCPVKTLQACRTRHQACEPKPFFNLADSAVGCCSHCQEPVCLSC